MNDDHKRIIIEGIDIPFMDLVVLLVKLAFAAIPAMIVIVFVFSLVTSLTGGLFNVLMFHM